MGSRRTSGTWWVLTLALLPAATALASGCSPGEARTAPPTRVASSPAEPAPSGAADRPARPRSDRRVVDPTADLHRVGELFLRFARSPRIGPPADTPIELYVGGRRARTIPGGRLDDPAAWRTCPAGGSAAGAPCPFSPLDALRSYPGVIAVTVAPPEHPCLDEDDVRAAPRTVTLTPAAPQTCTSYFAVRLHVNDVGQVTEVDLVHAEP